MGDSRVIKFRFVATSDAVPEMIPSAAVVGGVSVASVAALFVREDSIYKTMPGVDAWDKARDARLYDGPGPVVAHPPCRAWGNLSQFAKPEPGEKNLARLAVAMVRAFGGVVEHPITSRLWSEQGIYVGRSDPFGGAFLVVDQYWWGHRARKRTGLYIVGVDLRDLPSMPMVLGDAPMVAGRTTRQSGKKEITKAERERTPPDFAHWLVDVARSVN